MRVIFYADNDAKHIARSISEEGHEWLAAAAYLWRGEIERGDAVFAPGRDDIAAAYMAAGIPQWLPSGVKVVEQVKLPRLKEVVVLSCGPSAKEAIKRFPGIPVIGVNTAPWWYPCDYWIAIDGIELCQRLSNGQPVIGDPVRIVCDDKQSDRRGKWARLEDYGKRRTWSSATAVDIAAAIAGKVYCVGFDWKAGAGADGISSGRDESRAWAHEEAMVREIIKSSDAEILLAQEMPLAQPAQPVSIKRKNRRKVRE